MKSFRTLMEELQKEESDKNYQLVAKTKSGETFKTGRLTKKEATDKHWKMSKSGEYTNIDMKKLTESKDVSGWIAMYDNKKLEIKKSNSVDSLWKAKEHAVKELKVPKSKMGLLAIKPAFDESLNESEDTAEDVAYDVVNRVREKNMSLEKAFASIGYGKLGSSLPAHNFIPNNIEDHKVPMKKAVADLAAYIRKYSKLK